MKKVTQSVALIVATLVFCSSCASIVSKSIYPVTINSHPDGASILIKDEDGVAVFNGRTPSTVSLRAGAGFFRGKSYTVICTKPGYASQTVPIRRGVDGWYIAGNLLFGGLIGWLIVDPATGAMWTLQKNVSVELREQKSSMHDRSPTMHIATIDQVAEHLRSALVRIN